MITITFVIPAGIDYNGGIEKTVSRYINYNTPEFKKIVLQCNGGVNDHNIYSINSIYAKLIINTSGARNLFIRLISPLILFYDRIKNKKIIDIIEKNSDIIYLTNNDFYYLFKKAKIIIWSEHGNLPYNYTGVKLLNIIIYNLMKNNLIFRNVNYFHLLNCYNSVKIHDKPYFCVPNGIYSSNFIPSETINKKIKVLFVGRLEKSKGIDKILYIFKKYEMNMELIVAGSGELEYMLENKIKNVTFIKNPDDVKLRQIYSESDILLFPSTLENFGIVVLEALSSGLYVITSLNLKPRFDFAQNMGFLEYIDVNIDNIKKSLDNVAIKLEFTRNYKNKMTMHGYIKNNYDWEILLKDLYFKVENVYKDTGKKS